MKANKKQSKLWKENLTHKRLWFSLFIITVFFRLTLALFFFNTTFHTFYNAPSSVAWLKLSTMSDPHPYLYSKLWAKYKNNYTEQDWLSKPVRGCSYSENCFFGYVNSNCIVKISGIVQKMYILMCNLEGCVTIKHYKSRFIFAHHLSLYRY